MRIQNNSTKKDKRKACLFMLFCLIFSKERGRDGVNPKNFK